MRRKFLSFFSYAVIACMSAFALTACGDDDDNNPDAPDTPTGEATLVGTWEGYNVGVKYIMTMKSDQSGSLECRNANSGELAYKTDFSWNGFNNQLKLTITEDGEEEIEKYNIKRLDNEILIMYNDEVGSFCFINKNAQVTPTKELMVGKWLDCYQWSEDSQSWLYNELTQNSDGTGSYINGYSGNKYDVTWSFSGNILTQEFVGSDTSNVIILLACKNMLCCNDEGYYYVMLRE